jgi:hypothetical protein
MSGVYVGFQRPASEDMIVNFLGIDLGRSSYDCAALFFEVDGGDLVYFNGKINDTLREVRVSKLPPAAIRSLRKTVDYIDLSVTSEEHDRLLRTCRGCVTAKLGYNLRDILLAVIPLRNPEEHTLFNVKNVHDVQFIILALRECLSPDHRLLPLLRALHSRTTMTGQLFDVLSTAAFRTRSGSELIRDGGGLTP